MTALSKVEKRTLIADGVSSNRQILGQMVLEMGLEPIYAANGYEAVEQFKTQHPSLILMDINMPEMDGIQATKKIKAMAGDRFIPVIFVTKAEGHDLIKQAIEAGGDDYIQRPFLFELLKGKIFALGRIAQLYSQVNRLNYVRAHEEEVAEQLLSGAVESGNVALNQIKIHKQPAEVFSGDVLLTAFRPNGEVNVVLGDFTGHGLTSTIGALPLSETFRAMTAKGYDAEEIIAQINRKLQRLLPTGMFLAMGMVTLRSDGSVKIWNGGLPDILVISQGEIIQRIPSKHPPLGILNSVKDLYFEHISIEPEDNILMLSDGVLEAENVTGAQFGEERLLHTIASTALNTTLSPVDLIVRDLSDYMGDHYQKDDISLISIPGRVSADEQHAASVRSVNQHKGLTNEPISLDIWNWSLALQGRSLGRINPVAQALSRLQESEGGGEQWHSVFTILTELYANALDHGVLKLDSSLKSSPEGFAEYYNEREKRLMSLSSGGVSLYMQHTCLANGGRLKVRIEDSGDGFDYMKWLSEINRSKTFALSGRGIALVSELAESIRYENGGSAVEVVYTYTTIA